MRDTHSGLAGTRLNEGALLASSANPLLKSVRLLGKRRERENRHETWVEGARELRHALTGGWDLKTVLVREDSVDDHRDILTAARCWHRVSGKIFSRLVYRESTVTIGAVCAVPEEPAIRWDRSLMVLENVEKPGNIGAVLRSAEATGFPQIVVIGKADINNPNTIRASLGARFLLSVMCAETSTLQQQILDAQLPVYVLSPGASDAWPPTLVEPAVYVLGAEDRGVDSSWFSLGKALTLPMHGQIDSLNIAQTATVILYQRLASLELTR